jgi:hypothetical protein
MTASVYHSASTGYSSFWVRDVTTGQAQMVADGDSSYYNGKTVEFIDERPWVSLTQFGQIYWYGAHEEWLDGTWHNLGNETPDSIVMKSTVLQAQPGGMINSTSFDDFWYHC